MEHEPDPEKLKLKPSEINTTTGRIIIPDINPDAAPNKKSQTKPLAIPQNVNYDPNRAPYTHAPGSWRPPTATASKLSQVPTTPPPLKPQPNSNQGTQLLLGGVIVVSVFLGACLVMLWKSNEELKTQLNEVSKQLAVVDTFSKGQTVRMSDINKSVKEVKIEVGKMKKNAVRQEVLLSELTQNQAALAGSFDSLVIEDPIDPAAIQETAATNIQQIPPVVVIPEPELEPESQNSTEPLEPFQSFE
ncbi:MAG: hypothetical protein AAGA18_08385 [Verrucomicrobiota bacterium]